MDFLPDSTAPVRLLSIAILIAAAGLWLTVRLYAKGPNRSLPLGALYGAAWLLLAVWVVAPIWRTRPEIWHPPLVVFAVDDGPGFAALGARDSSRSTLAAARLHYESLGFRVEQVGFTTRIPGADVRRPNLQAVLLWSDGRFARRASYVDRDLSVPVFPVVMPIVTNEIQGEEVSEGVSGTGGDEGEGDADVSFDVAWRALGARPVNARAEIRVGNRVAWSALLTHPASVAAGERVVSRVKIPARLLEPSERNAARVDASGPAVNQAPVFLVKPFEDKHNVIAANDSVLFEAPRRIPVTQIFVRPVTSLAERGLMDALRKSRRESEGLDEGFSVIARTRSDVDARISAARRGSASAPYDARVVVWVNAAKTVDETWLRKLRTVPVIHYSTSPAKGGAALFGPDARIEFTAGGAAFLPAGALRLADLGVSDRMAGWALRPLDRAGDSKVEALAWAVEGGRRGLLFWRVREAEAGAAGKYGVAIPTLWDVVFRAGAQGGADQTVSMQWVRGVARWTRALGLQRTDSSATSQARTGIDDLKRHVSASKDPLRLGYDLEVLEKLAVRTDGRMLSGHTTDLRMLGNEGVATPVWPSLPGGQIRESRRREIPLAPPMPAALLILLLLASVWTMRKRHQLD